MIKEPHHANEQLSVCIDSVALKKLLSLVKVPPLQVAARCDRTTSHPRTATVFTVLAFLHSFLFSAVLFVISVLT